MIALTKKRIGLPNLLAGGLGTVTTNVTWYTILAGRITLKHLHVLFNNDVFFFLCTCSDIFSAFFQAILLTMMQLIKNVKKHLFILQVSGLLLAIAGFICAIISVPFDHLKFAHGGLGVVIMIIGVTQPLNALV